MTSVFNGSSQQGSILSLLKAATSPRKNATSGQQASTAVIDMIAKSDPEKARQLKEQQEKSGSILQQLQSMKSDQKAERKEAARQKVEQLKKQIQALRMMAAGDPKAAAKRAAQLARELANATKEYASAGGNTGDLGGVSTPAAQSAPMQQENTAAEQQSATNTPPAADISDQTLTPPASTDSDTPAQDSIAKSAPTARDIVNEKIAEANKSQAEREADNLFSNDVRKLLNDLKQIIKSAQQKLRDGGETGESQDASDAQKALREAELSLGDIASGGTDGAFNAINITV